MKFYRKATDKDFKKELEEYYLLDEFKKLIEKEKCVTRDTIKMYQEVTLLNYSKCKDELTQYLIIINAYNDFKNGQVVYVDYD